MLAAVPVDGYLSYQEKMIDCAPIRDGNGGFTKTYKMDRAKVWVLLLTLTRSRDCWTYVI
jgi:hypothetical protein